MGRSVSCPSRAVQRAYVDIDWMSQHEDDDGKPIEDDYLSECNWDDSVAELRAALAKRYKSVDECDKWLDREDHAISENQHAYIGVSTYCDMLCVWVVPKEPQGYSNERPELSAAWCRRIGASFLEVIETVYGKANVVRRVGTFSNGESVYQRGAA